MRRALLSLVVASAALAAAPLHAADCNGNGTEDAADLSGGTSQDCQANGIPDECDVSPLAFTTSSTAAGSLPAAVVAAELDGDEDLDLAVSNLTDDTITILRNTGEGTFTATGTIPTGARPEAFVVAVVSARSIIGGGSENDVIVANAQDDTVSLFRNNGDGTFVEDSASPFSVGDFPNAVVVADVTMDGYPEILVTNRDADSLTLILNDGTGSFSVAGSVAVGMSPRALLVHDVDADGDADVLTANNGDGTVTLLENDPVPVPAAVVATVPEASGLAASDVDSDGDVDLAVLSVADATIRIFLNDGTGSYTAGSVVDGGLQPLPARFVDVDDDGDADLVVPRLDEGDLLVALNDGGGAFQPTAAIPAGDAPVGVGAGDIDLDGRVDLVAPNVLADSVTVLRRTSAASADCDGNGVPDECEPGADCNENNVPDRCDVAPGHGFAAPNTTVPADPVRNVAVGDLDGDGLADVAAPAFPSSVQLFRGTAAATLEPLASFGTATDPEEVLLVDLDADGDLDVVVVSDAGASLTVLRNDGSGGVSSSSVIPVPSPGQAVAGDFDGDDDSDIMVVDTSGASVSFLASEDGTGFAPPVPITTGAPVGRLATGDADGDGDLDAVALTGLGLTAQVEVLRNDGGAPTAQPPSLTFTAPERPIGLLGGRVDGDDVLDLVVPVVDVTTGVSRMRVALNNGSGGFVLGQTLPVVQGVSVGLSLFVSAVVTQGLELGDPDADGDLDVLLWSVASRALRIYPNDGTGTFGTALSLALGDRGGSFALGDVDGDGGPDLVSRTRDGDVAVRRGLAVPTSLDCTGSGVPDECELVANDCNANGVPDTCELPAVDLDGNGVPDCLEEGDCGNCADDDGDGSLDLADPDCPSARFDLRKVRVRPAKGSRPMRGKVVGVLPTSLTLEDAALVLNVTFDGAPAYCGTPSLRHKGRGERLMDPVPGLRNLRLKFPRRKDVTRIKAVVESDTIVPAEGTIVGVSLLAGSDAFHEEVSLRAKKHKLVGP